MSICRQEQSIHWSTTSIVLAAIACDAIPILKKLTNAAITVDSLPRRFMIYLDHNSTSPLLPEGGDRGWAAAEAEQYANPASQHSEGRRANRALQNAREEIAELLGAKTHEPKMPIDSFSRVAAVKRTIWRSAGSGWRTQTISVRSSFHRSNIRASRRPPMRWLVRGVPIQKLAVTSAGVVRPEHLDELLATPPRLVSVMLANNETGVIQPLEEIVRRCSAAGRASAYGRFASGWQAADRFPQVSAWRR